MEQEFISRVGKKIKLEDTVTQILPHNLIQHKPECLKLGISAKARVYHQKVLCQKEERNPEGPNILKILALAKRFSS